MTRSAAVALGAALALIGAGRWLRDWGARPQERRAPLPGDDALPRARLVATRAIDVAAPAEAIWPWLVQMGWGRAGWYAYDLLDNRGRPSARRLLPGLGPLAPGDRLPTGLGPGFEVVAVAAPEHLVLRARGARGPLAGAFGWAIVLRPGAEATRLLMRVRVDWRPAAPAFLALPALAVDGLMMRRQLIGIRARAEAGRQGSGAGRSPASGSHAAAP